MNFWMIVLIVVIIGHFPLIVVFGIITRRRGWLTANRFALVESTYWSILSINLILAISTTGLVTIIGICLFILSWIVGFPLARWIYKQWIPDK
jgi:hypothetical protein